MLQSTGVQLEDYGAFPDIPGFAKAGTSNNTFTDYKDGENTTVYSFIQFYTPNDAGTFTLAPFKLKSNGKTVSHPGGTITVLDANGSATASKPEKEEDPLSEYLKIPTNDIKNLEPRGRVFFALSTDKTEVFVGQGFTATLALYVADNNTEEMDFWNVAEQLQVMVQQLKPVTCWEEDFGITEIQEIPVVIKGKRYSQFKIYQATYFPLNTDPVSFPAVGLKMLSGSVVNSFIDEPGKGDFKSFLSQPITVRVKPLPPHPLAGSVAVGVYKLVEFVSKGKVNTGQALNFRFSIRGEGNITAIKAPESPPGLPFDIYRPNSSQNIYRSLGRVTGEKTFSYSLVPQEPGIHNLGEGFQWIFFNTAKGQYDTLIANTKLKVVGERQEPTDMYGGTTDPFYADLKERNNGLKSLQRNRDWKEYANWALGVLTILGLVIIFVNGRKPPVT